AGSRVQAARPEAARGVAFRALFFFQAEDGIRDWSVTGVQTCALPIYQCRWELTYMALAPRLRIISPWKIDAFREKFPGRAEMIAYCRKHRIPVEASLRKSYSMDRNLLHISYESGILEDPWFDAFDPANRDMFKLSVSPEEAPDKAEIVTLDFVQGNCVAINGKQLDPLGVMKL